MIRWEELARAQVPGGDLLRLMRRGDEFSIMAGGIELMNSRLAGSEEVLAEIPLGRLAAMPEPNILVGGLGMGFTLRAGLKAHAGARFTVAELVPEIVDWARGALAPVFAGCLDDPRVAVAVGDVGAAMRAGRAAWDAILLDVDNGPEGLSRPGNDGLYSPAGLAAARAALRPGGLLAVWSAHPAPHFSRRFGQSGFVVDEIPIRARRTRGARHTIWVGTRR